MFNQEQATKLLENATKLGSTNSTIRSSALSVLSSLSGSSDPFQNAAIYLSSSSAGGPVYLGEGRHQVTTGLGNDQVYVGSANDFVNAGDGDNTLFLGEGFSVSIVGAGNNTIYGGSASDIVNAGDGNNILYLGEGVNVAVSGLGNNMIYAGAADDVIKAGDGNNTIYAAEGHNFVWTGKGNDLIYAGAGDDVIFSGAGNDTIYAGEGNNFISAGIGEDTVCAGSGRDRFELTKGLGAVTIIGFGIDDTLRFTDGITPTNLSFTIQNGDMLVSSGGDLLATLKWVQLNDIVIDNTPPLINIKMLESKLDEAKFFIDIAKLLWENRDGEFDPRKLAEALQKDGATAIQIAQALHYGLEFNLETIADALDDGATFGYTDIAEGLWNSGYNIDARKLADLLWDEGATEISIAQALKYDGISVEGIADALAYGVTKSDGTRLNYSGVAKGLWNSGYSFGFKKLADLLWDAGASRVEIGQALHYGIDRDLAGIASDLKYGVTTIDGSNLNYTDVAVGLWNSGYSFGSKKLADLLWDTGASRVEIGQALHYGIGLDLPEIAIDLKYGVTKADGSNLNYISVAVGLWNSGYSLDSRQLSDLLWDAGASQAEIGQALHYGINRDLAGIAYDLKYGVTTIDGSNLNYTDVAVGLWNSGHSIDAPNLAALLWDIGANPRAIGQAMKGIGFNLETIAEAVRNSPGIGFSYSDVAEALWYSGYSLDGANLASLLWNEGANQGAIGLALRSIGFLNEDIGYAVKTASGIGFNYRDVARAIVDSKEGVSQVTIADIVASLRGDYDDIFGALKEVGASDFDANKWALRASFQTILNRVFDYAEKASNKTEGIAEDIASDIKEAAPIILDVLSRIPVVGTAVAILDGVVSAINGNERDTFKNAIISALRFYGAANIITSKMVGFAVDVFWEIKDERYKEATAVALKDLGLEKKVADVFVAVAWAMKKGDWKTAVEAALNAVGFKNAKEFATLAWDVIDKNYQDLIKVGLNLVGISALGIDQSKVDSITKITAAIRNRDFNQVADQFISMSGSNAPKVRQSD